MMAQHAAMMTGHADQSFANGQSFASSAVSYSHPNPQSNPQSIGMPAPSGEEEESYCEAAEASTRTAAHADSTHASAGCTAPSAAKSKPARTALQVRTW